MATSGNIDKALASWLTMRINWVVNSQDAAANKSNVTVKVQLITGNGSISSTASKAIKVSINGTTYSDTTTVGIAKNTTKTLYTKTVDVPHNADGTKSLALNCTLTFDATISGSKWGDKYSSGTATLNAIARASTFTRSGTATMGIAQTITIKKKNSSFTHTLKYSWGGSTTTIVSKTTADSYTWTPNVSMATKIPNASSGECVLTCETYNGSTLVGSAAISFTLSVPASVVPKITDFAHSEAVTGLMEKFGNYVDTKSKITYAVFAEGAQGSTIKSYSVTIAGQHYSTATGTTKEINVGLTEFGDDVGSLQASASVTVTDSRGRSATAKYTFTVLRYVPPTLTGVSVTRCNSSGTPDDNGTYLLVSYSAKIAKVSSLNSGTLSVDYKQTSVASYSTHTSKTFTSTLSENLLLNKATFTTDTAYHVRITITDYFTTIKSVFEVSTAKPMLDLKANKKGVGIGSVATEDNLLDIGFRTRFYGGVLQRILEAGTDFDTVTTPNVYTLKNANAANYKNCPFTTGTGVLRIETCGEAGQIRQLATVCDKTNPLEYERYYYQSEWGVWRRRFGVTLYNNSSGTDSGIILNENVLTGIFKYIEIFYSDNNNKIGGYVKIFPPFTRTICLSIIEAGSSTSTYIRRTQYSISETNLGYAQLLPDLDKGAYMVTNGSTTNHYGGGENYIKIFRVVGYE